MVSGGTVTSDLSILTSSLTKYSSEISGLSGSWKGASFDGISSKAEAFASEYSSTISGQMNAFASACDLYKEYEQCKRDLSSAESNYNAAVSNKDSSSMTNYGNQVASLKAKLNNLKGQIESYLSTASSGKLEASSLTGTTATPTGTGAAISTTGGQFVADNSKGVYGYITSSIDGKTHAIYRQSQIEGWSGYCNRAAAASIASGYASYNGQAVDIAKKTTGGLGFNSNETNKYFNQFGLSATVNRINGSYDNIKSDIVTNLSSGNYVMFDLSQPNVHGQSGQKWSSTRHWVSVLDIKKVGSGPNDYAIFVSDSGHGGSTVDHGLGTGWYSLDEFSGQQIANFTTVTANAKAV